MTIQMMPILSALVTIGTRIAGLMLFAPFFGSTAIPARIKPVLVVALTALLYPMLSHQLPVLKPSEWPVVIFSELLIGAAIGISANLVFDGAQMAGQILSVQMGYSLINILDPQTQVESTVVALFHQTLAMLIFLRAGVHLWLLRAVAHSFDYLPPSSGNFSPAFVRTLLHSAASVFSIGVQIAAPVLAATLLTDLALGLLGKASPQLPLMTLGPTIKSVLGLFLLMATLQYWPSLFQHLFLNSIAWTDRLLHLTR